MAYTAWRILVNLTAVNAAGPAFSSLINAIQNAHTSTANLQLALQGLKVGGTFALEELGKAGINAFSHMAQAAGDVQMKMILMRQALSDGSRDMGPIMDRVYKQQIELSSGATRTLFSMQQIADVQMSLVRSGIRPEAFTKQVSITDRFGTRAVSVGQLTAYAAEIENLQKGVEPGTAASNIGQFLQGYGLGGDPVRSSKVIEAFTAASSISKFSSAGLRTTETYLGQLARTLKMSPEDVVLASAYFAQRGMNPSTASTSFANFLMGTISPVRGATAQQYSMQIQARARLGAITGANPAEAKRAMDFQQAAMRRAGLPVDDLSQMTATQQEKYARILLANSMHSTVLDYYRRAQKRGQPGMQGIADWVDESKHRYEKQFGVEVGDRKWAGDMVAAFNIRGARSGYSLDAADMTRVFKSMQNQAPLEERMRELRSGTLFGVTTSLENEMHSLMVMLGGGGNIKPTAGSPLAIGITVLNQLNTLLTAIMKFGADHPNMMGYIGTLVGIVGVISSIGAILLGFSALAGIMRIGGPAIAAILSAMGLGGVIPAARHAVGNAYHGVTRGLGGRFVAGTAVAGRQGWLGAMFNPFHVWNRVGAGIGGAARGIGGALGHTFGPPLEYLREFLFGHPFRPTQHGPGGRFLAGTQILEDRGFLGIGRAFRQLGALAARIAPLFGMLGNALRFLAPRILGIVGWVTLAVDALHFFTTHPELIAHWVAQILLLWLRLTTGTNKFFEHDFIPMILGWFTKLLQNLGTWFSQIFTDLGRFPDTIKKISAAVKKEVDAADPNKKKPEVPKKTSNSGPISFSPTINVHGSMDQKTGDHVIRKLADAAKRSFWDGNPMGGPNTPYSVVGVS